MNVRYLLFASFALAGAPAVSAQSSQDQASVAGQEKAWSDAYLAHDIGKLSSILADDFVGFDSRGMPSTKADELAEAAPPKPGAPAQIVREQLSDVKVRVYGDSAVLTALNTVTFAGGDSVGYRRTTVWVRTAAGWRCVSFHASRAP